MATSKRKPRKQSGPKVSTIAGRLLRELQTNFANWHIVSSKELEALCASVLSQDESKGQWTKKS